jgi:hypothetical protein
MKLEGIVSKRKKSAYLGSRLGARRTLVLGTISEMSDSTCHRGW